MTSARVLRLADQIKAIVAGMLQQRIKDPRLGFVTITDVRLTGDTRDATIFYTVLGEDADLQATGAALSSATKVIRSEVAKQLDLRFAPTVTFVADAVPESARQIEELLAEARASDAEVAQRAVGAAYAGETDPYDRAGDEPEDQDS